jgi:hypothetical protein
VFFEEKNRREGERERERAIKIQNSRFKKIKNQVTPTNPNRYAKRETCYEIKKD